jgi:hypothetical protein
LEGLVSLNQVTGDLNISDNDSLVNLAGLESLSLIEGLIITNNVSLQNLNGIDQITNIDGNLTLQYNDLLSSCAVNSICVYLANPNGAINIRDNKIGCNTIAQVESACLEVGTNEVTKSKRFIIYPNPAKSSVYISSVVGHFIENASVYNFTGQKLFQSKYLPDEGLDVSALRQGSYFVEILSGGDRSYFKLILGN